MIEVHAVRAIYEDATFNPRVSIATEQPVEYRCTRGDFRGNLEESVTHIIEHQFVVPPLLKWEDRLK